MKVLLVDIDGKIPNLALMKISAYYERYENAEVGFNVNNPDVIYVSSIFKRNKSQALGLKTFYNAQFNIGGSGINNYKLPALIEGMKPDYDLYPSTYSQGYTTRGCIRNCPWCIVRDKEGKQRRHQHIKNFHEDCFDTVMVMDNNWLADKDWFFENTDFILENDLKVIEHGMDIRLLDPEIADRLSELKFAKPMKFAFDQIKHENAVMKGIELLSNAGINLRQNVMFYVLCGYNTTPREDLYRCNLLKGNGVSAFVMPYKKTNFTKDLARWANRKWLFWGLNFTDYSNVCEKVKESD